MWWWILPNQHFYLLNTKHTSPAQFSTAGAPASILTPTFTPRGRNIVGAVPLPAAGAASLAITVQLQSASLWREDPRGEQTRGPIGTVASDGASIFQNGAAQIFQNGPSRRTCRTAR